VLSPPPWPLFAALWASRVMRRAARKSSARIRRTLRGEIDIRLRHLARPRLVPGVPAEVAAAKAVTWAKSTHERVSCTRLAWAGLRVRVPARRDAAFLSLGAAAVAAQCGWSADAMGAAAHQPPAGYTDPAVLELVAAAVAAETKDMLLRLVPTEVLARLKQSFPGAELRDLARFAIACNHEVPRARERYRHHLKWRQTELPRVVHGTPTLDVDRLDGTTDEEIIAELRTGKMMIRGHDREGRPIMVWNSLRHDPKTASTEAVLRMVVYLMEATVLDMGDEFHQVTMLIYTPPGSRSSFDMQLVQGAVKIFAAQYPERLGRVIVCPVTTGWRWIWTVASKFLPAQTRDKVRSGLWRGLFVYTKLSSLVLTNAGASIVCTAHRLCC
jgi:hypothetical protein